MRFSCPRAPRASIPPPPLLPSCWRLTRMMTKSFHSFLPILSRPGHWRLSPNNDILPRIDECDISFYFLPLFPDPVADNSPQITISRPALTNAIRQWAPQIYPVSTAAIATGPAYLPAAINGVSTGRSIISGPTYPPAAINGVSTTWIRKKI